MATILNSANLNSTILDSAILVSPLKLTHTCQDWFPPFPKKNFSHSSLFTICTKYFTHSIWLTWWWQPSWILPSWIQPFCTKKKLLSFILTQLDDGSPLEFCQLEFHHLGFSHLSISSQTHSHLPRLVPTFCPQKTSLIHSDSTWWWQPSWILPSWIQPFWTKLWLKLIQSDSNSFIPTQLDDDNHL